MVPDFLGLLGNFKNPFAMHTYLLHEQNHNGRGKVGAARCREGK